VSFTPLSLEKGALVFSSIFIPKRPNFFGGIIMYFFTADEHYGHSNIIRFSNRPFKDIMEMDEALINNNNSVVKERDIVIHAGDFCWFKRYSDDRSNDCAVSYINRLNGNHVFLKGSHDYWLPRGRSMQIWEKKLERNYIVVCHYAMHTWARSHYNSWHLYAHSHRDLGLPGKRHCISVDNTDFFPLSFDQIKEIMKDKQDNPNFIKPGGKRNA